MNVETIVKNGQCSSCGVCVSVCPKKCISLKLINRNATVVIDNGSCSQCGICYAVCPFSDQTNFLGKSGIESFNLGERKQILCAVAKDKKLLEDCTSGGVVTSTIMCLLEKKIYDSAFVVKGYGIEDFYYTERVTKPEELADSSKSRYVTVSHEKSVKYMLDHPKEKMIIVGVPCAIRGISKCIEKRGLERNNYLLLGLFCDKALTYGVFEYFKEYPLCKGKRITRFNFRDKSSGGWPGDVRIEFEDGSFADVSGEERIRVKDYFTPESCLYCLDKLNTCCDIAMGDNYIPANNQKEGVSSVIVRSDQGEQAWNIVCNEFELKEDSEEDLLKSQHISSRNENYLYAGIKGLTGEYPSLIRNAWVYLMYYRKMKYIKIGRSECDNLYQIIRKENDRRRFYWRIMSTMGYPYRALRSLRCRHAERRREG